MDRRPASPEAATPAEPSAPEQMAEAEFDEEDRILIKTPLAPPPRPAPTRLKFEPPSQRMPPMPPMPPQMRPCYNDYIKSLLSKTKD